MSEKEVFKGKTKWFDVKKGFGFLTRDDGVDFFVHFSNIAMEGYKVLEKEQKVAFEVGPDTKRGPDGKQAVNVVPVATIA